MTQFNHLSDGRSDGTMLGQNTTDKVGFFGTTPRVQVANVVDATDAATAITKLNAVIAGLEALGLFAAS
jgi:hypothetical protein